jgi:hypothetical protein
VEKLGKARYRIAQSCVVRGRRETERLTYEIISPREYKVMSRAGDSLIYRQSALPEPWRTNEVPEIRSQSTRNVPPRNGPPEIGQRVEIVREVIATEYDGDVWKCQKLFGAKDTDGMNENMCVVLESVPREQLSPISSAYHQFTSFVNASMLVIGGTVLHLSVDHALAASAIGAGARLRFVRLSPIG